MNFELDTDPITASRTFDELIASADEQLALYKQNFDNVALDLTIRHYCAAFDLGPAPDTTVDYVFSYLRFCYTLFLRGDDAITNRYIDKVSKRRRIQNATHVPKTQQTFIWQSGLKTAVNTIAATQPQRVHLLMQYGSALHIRHTALNDEKDLNLAIQQFMMALEDCPDDLLVAVRRSLVMALDSRYKLRYDIDDIDLSVKAYADVINMLQPQPKEYLIACMGYAMVLRVRFYRKGDPDDLHVAVRYFEVVITKCPPSHNYHSSALVFYASLLMDRSEQRVSTQDVDKAIEYIRKGIAAGRANDPSRPELLSILGYYLVSRFMHCGSVTDLESGVENCHTATSSHSSLDAGTRAVNMSRLAFSLFTPLSATG